MNTCRTYHSWVWVPEIFFVRLWAEGSGKVPAKAHVRATHQRHLGGIELAIRVACLFKPGAGHGASRLCALSGAIRIDIVQIVLSKLDAHCLQIQSPDQAGEFVPWNKLVDEMEERDGESVEKTGLVAGSNRFVHDCGDSGCSREIKS
jgi:hypothetical protein